MADLQSPVNEALEYSDSFLPAVSKSKGNASITPKSFRRFFAPRCSLQASKPEATARDALGDLSSFKVNSLARLTEDQLFSNSSRSLDCGENPPTGSSYHHWKSCKLSLKCSTIHVDRPRKRQKLSTHNERIIQRIDSSSTTPVPVHEDTTRPCCPRPVQRSQVRYALGETVSRELALESRSWERPKRSVSSDFFGQSHGFSSGPEHVHLCRHSFSTSYNSTLPFSTAACNTNSLVAIGDEDGVIRLLETKEHSSPSFDQSYLIFRPHKTAILDMVFSMDDALLATAPGDHICKIIDMQTQQDVYSLDGHTSSAKQVRFQPGSCNSVIATSSRDGSVRVWDLRCSSSVRPAQEMKPNVENNQPSKQNVTPQRFIANAACVNLYNRAHGSPAYSEYYSKSVKAPRVDRAMIRPTAKTQIRNDVSVTAISFLSANNPHILLSGGEAEAVIKVWDLRRIQLSRYNNPIPLSTTQPPPAHQLQRHFGLTSMAVACRDSRLFALCKDNTVYAYSTSHLVSGCSPEFDGVDRKPRRVAATSTGLGPLYGLRHPQLTVSSFYVKLAIRRAKSNKVEMLATGSSSSNPVLFPTYENLFRRRQKPCGPPSDNADFPIYHSGTALVHGHGKEVTGVGWSVEGSLVTLSDDGKCRLWNDKNRPPSRAGSCDGHGKRLGYGWAENSWNNGDIDEVC